MDTPAQCSDAGPRVPQEAFEGRGSDRSGSITAAVFGDKKGSSDSVLATVDPESLRSRYGELTHGSGSRARGFALYFSICMLVTLACSGATVGLWSDWGCGPHCLQFLQRRSRYAAIFCGILVAVVLVLYVLDFFCPPHLPGRHLTLSAEGHALSRGILLLAGCSLIVAFALSAASYPGAPMLLTTFAAPVLIIAISRWCYSEMPSPDRIPEASEEEGRASSKGSNEELEWRKSRLIEFVRSERDQKVFYSAATLAFALTGTLWIVVWVPWAFANELATRQEMGTYIDQKERELFVIRWAAPVILAVSYALFAAFTGLRFALNRAYNATDVQKNRLFVGRRLNPELTDHHVAAFLDLLHRSGTPPEVMLQSMQDRRQTYLVQHISYMRQLSGLVKSVACSFIACLGGLYVAFQLTVTDSQVALFVQGFVGAVFLLFVGFVFASFRRLFEAISSWLIDLPVWRSAVALCQRPFARGFTIFFLLPFLPLVLLLSCCNQLVRRLRGLVDERTWLTTRVRANLEALWGCDWVAVAPWCFIWSYVAVIYTATPVFLYVLLAWLGDFMRSWPFGLILLATFAAGMFLFMLPPVPGPPIYLFGGVVISEQCPWGFWWGSVICIILAFVLKLTACTVQQKLIGERLGGRLSVRRTVGVHKPFIRAIELILRRPGLNFGKVAILCGGPDWPTSVLAGILRLSLWQCLLGTCPIILNCIPLTLTGSFLTRRHESEVWLRSGNLMFTLTVITSVVFWIGMAWAVQDAFEKNMDELVRVKEEYLELDWLDYRDEFIAERSVVHWGDLPTFLRKLYATGALLAILAGNLFFWRPTLCFGSHKVTAGIEGVVWFGNTGIIRPAGAAGLAVVAFCVVVHVAGRLWVRRRRRERAAAAALECAPLEEDWKRRRLEEARKAEVPLTSRTMKAISSDEFFVDLKEVGEAGCAHDARAASISTAPPESVDACVPEECARVEKERDLHLNVGRAEETPSIPRSPCTGTFTKDLPDLESQEHPASPTEYADPSADSLASAQTRVSL